MLIAERRKALRRVKLRWELCMGLGFTLDSKVPSFCLRIIHLQYSRLGVCIGERFKLGGLVIVRARAEQSHFFLPPKAHQNTLHIQKQPFPLCIHGSASCHHRGLLGFFYSLSSSRQKAEAIPSYVAAVEQSACLLFSYCIGLE